MSSTVPLSQVLTEVEFDVLKKCGIISERRSFEEYKRDLYAENPKIMFDHPIYSPLRHLRRVGMNSQVFKDAVRRFKERRVQDVTEGDLEEISLSINPGTSTMNELLEANQGQNVVDVANAQPSPPQEETRRNHQERRHPVGRGNDFSPYPQGHRMQPPRGNYGNHRQSMDSENVFQALQDLPRRERDKVLHRLGVRQTPEAEKISEVERLLNEAKSTGDASRLFDTLQRMSPPQRQPRMDDHFLLWQLKQQKLTKFDKRDDAELWISRNESLLKAYDFLGDDKWPSQMLALIDAFSGTHIEAWAMTTLRHRKMDWEIFKGRLLSSFPKADKVRAGREHLDTTRLTESNNDVVLWISEFETALCDLQEDSSQWETAAVSIYLLSRSVYPRMSKRINSELEKRNGNWSFREAADMVKQLHEELSLDMRRSRSDHYLEVEQHRRSSSFDERQFRRRSPERTPMRVRFDSPYRNASSRTPGGRSMSPTPYDHQRPRASSDLPERPTTQQSPHRNEVRCYKCQELGHYSSDCKRPRSNTPTLEIRKNYDKYRKEATQDSIRAVNSLSSLNDSSSDEDDSIPNPVYAVKCLRIEEDPPRLLQTHERISKKIDVDELTKSFCPPKVLYTTTADRRTFVKAEIDGVTFKCLADTGSERTVIGTKELDEINCYRASIGLPKKILKDNWERIKGINDVELSMTNELCAAALIKFGNFESYERVIFMKNHTDGVILSSLFLEAANSQFNWLNRSMVPNREGLFRSRELSSRSGIPMITIPPGLFTDAHPVPTVLKRKLFSLGPNSTYSIRTLDISSDIMISGRKGIALTREDNKCCMVNISGREMNISDESWVGAFKDAEPESAIDWSSEMDEGIISPDLTESQRNQALSLLKEFEDIFSDTPGEFKDYEAKIELVEGCQPICLRPYDYDPPVQAIMDDLLKEHVRKGFLRDATGEGIKWAFPPVLHRKFEHLSYWHDDQKNRVVCDYRKLNKLIKKYPTVAPEIKHVLAELVNATWLNAFDLPNAYHQIRLEKSSQECTAIRTPTCIYVWERLPQGITTGCSIFQEVANHVCKDIKRSVDGYRRVIPYMDDVIVTGETFEESLDYVREFFKKCRHHGLNLSRKKLRIGYKKLRFLGQEIVGSKIYPNPVKVKSVTTLPFPKTLSELRSLLGMINYVAPFIKNSALMLRPLHDLTRGLKGKGKHAEITPTDEAVKALQDIKNHLTTEDLGRAFFNPNCDLEIFTDASNRAIGGIIFQIEPDKSRKILATHSRSLKSYEENSTITHKECLAILDIVQNNRSFLMGCRGKITVFTDHCSLCWLDNMKDINFKLTRWAIALSPYRLEIKHVKGRLNVIADHLSRWAVNDSVESDHWDGITINSARIDSSGLSSLEKSLLDREQHLKPSHFKHLDQQSDPKLKKKICDLQGLKDQSMIKGYILKNGILYKACFCPELNEQRFVVCIGNKSLRKQMFNLIHQRSHCGVDQTFLRLSRRMFWPHMYDDLSEWTSSCDRCQRGKEDLYAHRKKFYLTDLTDKPFQGWSLDFAVLSGPDQKSDATCFIVAVDFFSRYLEAKHLPSQKAGPMIKFIKQSICLRHGTPKIIRSDAGPAFTSKEFELFCQENNIDHQLNTPGHSTGNSLAESKIHSLRDRLRTLLEDNKTRQWDSILQEIVFDLNATIDKILKKSPFAVVHGHEPRLDIDNYLPLEEPSPKELSLSMIRKDKQLEVINDPMVNSERFVVGDKVLLRQVNTNKLKDLYVGPFVITKAWAKGNFTIKHLKTSESRHVNQQNLKKYYSSVISDERNERSIDAAGDRSTKPAASLRSQRHRLRCDSLSLLVTRTPDNLAPFLSRRLGGHSALKESVTSLAALTLSSSLINAPEDSSSFMPRRKSKRSYRPNLCYFTRSRQREQHVEPTELPPSPSDPILQEGIDAEDQSTMIQPSDNINEWFSASTSSSIPPVTDQLPDDWFPSDISSSIDQRMDIPVGSESATSVSSSSVRPVESSTDEWFLGHVCPGLELSSTPSSSEIGPERGQLNPTSVLEVILEEPSAMDVSTSSAESSIRSRQGTPLPPKKRYREESSTPTPVKSKRLNTRTLASGSSSESDPLGSDVETSVMSHQDLSIDPQEDLNDLSDQFVREIHLRSSSSEVAVCSGQLVEESNTRSLLPEFIPLAGEKTSDEPSVSRDDEIETSSLHLEELFEEDQQESENVQSVQSPQDDDRFDWEESSSIGPAEACLRPHFGRIPRYREDKKILELVRSTARQVFLRYCEGLLSQEDLIRRALRQSDIKLPEGRSNIFGPQSIRPIFLNFYEKTIDGYTPAAMLIGAARGNIFVNLKEIHEDSSRSLEPFSAIQTGTVYYMVFKKSSSLKVSRILEVIPDKRLYPGIENIQTDEHSGFALYLRFPDIGFQNESPPSITKVLEFYCRIQQAGPVTIDNQKCETCPLARSALVSFLLSGGCALFMRKETRKGRHWFFKALKIESHKLFHPNMDYKPRFRVRIWYFSSEDNHKENVILFCAPTPTQVGHSLESLPWKYHRESRTQSARYFSERNNRVSHADKSFFFSGFPASSSSSVIPLSERIS